MFLSEINAALSIIERIKKWRNPKNEPPQESISARFVRLFENHGVHRNQIPRFFGHGLTVKDMQDDESLCKKLDESVLEAACSKFGVRREWLDGAEAQIYLCHDFYKHPEDVEGFLDSIMTSNPAGNLDGVLIAPDKREGAAVIVFYEIIGAIGEKPIYRYHLCNNWMFDYWKSRAYLTAAIAIAWRHSVHVRGVYAPEAEVVRIASGESLLDSEGGTGPFFSGKKWYPEDMALKPAEFLLGIDPEQDNFGNVASLRLWLELEQEGYMGTGMAMYDKMQVRQLFEQKLRSYEPRGK